MKSFLLCGTPISSFVCTEAIAALNHPESSSWPLFWSSLWSMSPAHCSVLATSQSRSLGHSSTVHITSVYNSTQVLVRSTETANLLELPPPSIASADFVALPVKGHSTLRGFKKQLFGTFHRFMMVKLQTSRTDSKGTKIENVTHNPSL